MTLTSFPFETLRFSEILTSQETLVSQVTQEPQAPTEASPVTYDTDFPLPQNVQNFQKFNEQQINYQTNMGIDEIIAFYRQELITQGLWEVGELTQINEDNFSMVFSGAPDSMEIVIQGVQLDSNTLNVNVRYEDV